MIVKKMVSQLWKAPFPDLEKRLGDIFDSAPDSPVFFRADDIGVPGDNCREMMWLFRTHRFPLHMAVTPSWLTESRWSALSEWAGEDDIFIWHQHGWRHQNHQKQGKKSEFGTDRDKATKRTDLAKGRIRLETIMGESFTPVFTPPWNRFDAETGEALAELGYHAVSRSAGEQRKVPLNELPDIPINVDLHTRREITPEAGQEALLDEFQKAADAGRIGIMIHHQRMNQAAFSFLDICLGLAARHSGRQKLRMDRL